MAEVQHSALTGADIHTPHRQVFADAAARAADSTTYTSDDLGALAYQTDTGAVYVLTAITPTWTLQVQQSDRLDFESIPLVEATVYSTVRAPYDCTVTAADLLPHLAAPTAGTLTVSVANVTQSRTVVAAADVRASLNTLDSAEALTVGTGTAVQADAGDVLRCTVVMDASIAPIPVSGAASAYVQPSLTLTPRGA